MNEQFQSVLPFPVLRRIRTVVDKPMESRSILLDEAVAAARFFLAAFLPTGGGGLKPPPTR